VNAIQLHPPAWARGWFASRREERSDLRDARARLHAYRSPFEALSAQEKKAIFSYEGPEVSGSLPKRRR
jgi:hypothetical protein